MLNDTLSLSLHKLFSERGDIIMTGDIPNRNVSQYLLKKHCDGRQKCLHPYNMDDIISAMYLPWDNLREVDEVKSYRMIGGCSFALL